MLLAAVSLTVDLVAVVLGNPNEGSMAVAIAAVLYANQRRIQLLFRERAGRGVRTGEDVGCPIPRLTWTCCAATSRCCTSPAARCSCPPGSTATCGAARCGGPVAGARTSSWPRSARSPRTTSPIWLPGASGATDYLRFVQEPMDFAGYRAWRSSTDRPTFSAIGRWARVGVASRLLDAGFDISLSLRGVVPGGTVAVAERQYSAMQAEQPGYSYYGRVVREGGYIACHYLFFYVMNDFRSTFFGVNDHEADWEQVIVYLTEPAPGLGRRADPDLGGLRRARPARGRPAPPVRRPAAAPGRRHRTRW